MKCCTDLAMTPIDSGYWWVRRASSAVKEHSPAVKRMKNGNSFFGYTDTSWNAGNNSLSAHSERKIKCIFSKYLSSVSHSYLCNLDRGRTDVPSPEDREGDEMFLPRCNEEDWEPHPPASNASDDRMRNWLLHCLLVSEYVREEELGASSQANI